MNAAKLRPYLRRLMIILGVSLVLVFALSELGFYLQVLGGDTDRLPEQIELLIPAGTAQRVAAGEAVPSIPTELTFVQGDVLVVKNNDEVAHELGPLIVPPGSSASLPLNEADHFALSCSFQPTRYLGLDVQTPSTLSTRALAILYAAPPTVVMFFIYSLLIWPIKPAAAESPAKIETSEA